MGGEGRMCQDTGQTLYVGTVFRILHVRTRKFLMGVYMMLLGRGVAHELHL